MKMLILVPPAWAQLATAQNEMVVGAPRGKQNPSIHAPHGHK